MRSGGRFQELERSPGVQDATVIKDDALARFELVLEAELRGGVVTKLRKLGQGVVQVGEALRIVRDDPLRRGRGREAFERERTLERGRVVDGVQARVRTGREFQRRSDEPRMLPPLRYSKWTFSCAKIEKTEGAVACR